MPLFDMFYRDTIKSQQQSVSTAGTVDEFDNLSARISAWALREHNEDGTHNVRPSGFDFVPIGAMLLWGSTSTPNGWLICDGTQVSRNTYSALFNIIGTTYGAGDGSTTFNLPDLRLRFPIGKAASGTASTLGSSGGAFGGTHTHFVSGQTIGSISIPPLSLSASGSTDSQGSHSHGGATGGSGSTTDSAGNHDHFVNTSDPSDNASDVPNLLIDVDRNLDGSWINVARDSHIHGMKHHTHSITLDGSHSHNVNSHSHGIGSDGTHSHSVSVSGATSAGSTGSISVAPSTTGSADVTPPYLVVNYIILAGV